MEQFDLYNKDRVLIGQKMNRGDAQPENTFRLVIHICIFSSRGEMLIQQRHATKKSNPNIWDLSLGGCSQAGETSSVTAQRELSEELGLYYDFSNESPYFTINFGTGFDDYYFIKKDVDLKDVKFVDNEVQAVKWASKEEILKLIEEHKFINYHPSLISMIFDMLDNRGAFKA